MWFFLQIDDNLEENRSGPTAQAIAAHTYDTAQQSTTPHHIAAPHNIEKPTSSPVQGPNRQPSLTRPVHAALCEYHSANPFTGNPAGRGRGGRATRVARIISGGETFESFCERLARHEKLTALAPAPPFYSFSIPVDVCSPENAEG